jgi:hypothetical protein
VIQTFGTHLGFIIGTQLRDLLLFVHYSWP